MGAAYGTAKSSVGVTSMGLMRPELVMKSIVPVVMAGVLGIYDMVLLSSLVPGSILRPNRTTYSTATLTFHLDWPVVSSDTLLAWPLASLEMSASGTTFRGPCSRGSRCELFNLIIIVLFYLFLIYCDNEVAIVKSSKFFIFYFIIAMSLI
ncbi:unnamed protein product [Linum tenue]|nr:unnamed protein product [Linum tenue]